MRQGRRQQLLTRPHQNSALCQEPNWVIHPCPWPRSAPMAPETQYAGLRRQSPPLLLAGKPRESEHAPHSTAVRNLLIETVPVLPPARAKSPLFRSDRCNSIGPALRHAASNSNGPMVRGALWNRLVSAHSGCSLV